MICVITLISTSNITPQKISAATLPDNNPVLSTTIAVTSTPKLAEGAEIELPYGKKLGMSLKYSSSAVPAIAEAEVIQVIYHYTGGQDWALANGTKFLGKTPVSAKANFGLATLGGFTPNGRAWVGPQGFAIHNCDSMGKCVDTGKTLAHIENRPIWLVDYSGLTHVQPMPMCPPGQTCNQPASTTNHVVYVVDPETRSVLLVRFYHD